MINGPRIFVADVGTSSLKAGIIDRNGTLLWQVRIPMLSKEEDLEYWEASRWAPDHQKKFSRLPKGSIDGIVLSGNGPTMVPLDAKDVPTSPVLLWIDGRSRPIEGKRSFFLPKVRWFRETNPEAFAKTRSFLSCPEYLSFLLTGVKATISPTNEFLPFLWDDDQLSTYQLSPDLFPPFVEPSNLLGRVSARGAQKFGLKLGIPVFAGGTDFMMSLTGSGTISPGMACDRAGTSEGINYCSDMPIRNPSLRTLPHAIEGLYNVAGILSSTGRMFEWFRRFSGQHDIDYAPMIERIEAVHEWANLPFFFPSAHLGEQYEFTSAVFANLRPEHGAPEMGRAVLESIGFTIRRVVGTLESSGCPVTTLRACGGQAKNWLWNQMKSNMIDRPIDVPYIKDAELLGCGIEGFLGLGEYRNREEASGDLVRIEHRFEPDRMSVERYQERFSEYEKVHSALGNK